MIDRNFNIEFSEQNTEFALKFNTDEEFNIEFSDIKIIGGETYAGPYDVTPTAAGFSMSTAAKVMMRDVNVKPIPYYETSNISGITVYIAGTINN